MNTTHAYIQNEKSAAPIQDTNRILRFSQGNISYKVDVSSKESRLECIKQLRENTGRNFRWFKETTGNRHWVIYDSDMYEILDECNTNLLGLEKFAYLHYKEKSELEPELPINATSCHCMFYQCSLIKTCTLEKELFDTTNIVTMFGMFSACSCLEHLDVSALATLNLENIAEMFRGYIILKEIDLRNFDTSKVIDMEKLFDRCHSLTKILLTGLDTSNVIYMNSVFKECHRIEELDLRSFSTASATEAYDMFNSCYSLSKIIISNKWDMSEIYEADWMFNLCEKLTNYDRHKIDASMAKPIEQGGYLTLE